MPAAQLTIGDVIELNAGDLIPADARIIEAKDFYVNQASLTGESFPIEKTSMPMSPRPKDFTSMHNMVFSGTGVHTGWARAIIVAIGKQSEFGKLTQTIREIDDHDEFSTSLHRFSDMIIRIIVVLVAVIFGVRAAIYHDIWTSLEFAVAVAVGLTPEFLPMIMSVTMGKGSVQMAKNGVIVKKLTAIPTFGSMDVLCTDKTGTLTENRIAVVKYVDLFNSSSSTTLTYAYLNSYFQSGITNPMDDAVIAYAKQTDLTYEKVDEIPFDFERRRLTVVLKKNDTGLMITKGAPESMFSVIDRYWYQQAEHPLTKESRDRYTNLYHDLSCQGFRVLAVATKPIDPTKHPYSSHDEHDLVFAGFIAFLDPPKTDVRHAIDELESLGIDMKVISGDNELVTEHICREVDVPIKGILLGSQLDAITDDMLKKKVLETTIFARFNPEQKNRVIKALQMNGHVVGYMGDGINDAPSLMTADVGISVANAVDVARESADMVLTQKSLDLLAEGVKAGRRTFGNVMKYIMMGLSSNFGNMFSMLGAVLFLPFLPMLPMQILLNNFLYDLSQITIPTDTVDEDYVVRPKRMGLKQIRTFMFIFGPISSIFDFITFGFMYLLFSHNPTAFQTGWFMESLATQALVIFVIRTRKLPFIQSRPSIWLTLTTLLVVAFGWYLPYSPLAAWFGFTRLSAQVATALAVIVLVYLLVVGFAKQYYHHLMAKEVYAA
jgi:Mg2+-importing ATPase